MPTQQPPVGVVLPGRIPPQHIPRLARVIESLGYASVWLPEDAFDRGGIASLMAALDHTARIRVGLGIAPALVRHPAFLAMELATIAAIHGERVVPGIGLGVPAWLEQMGTSPRSQRAAVRETVLALRRLLAGETLDEAGEATYRDITLTFPPGEGLPLLVGVTGPRLLAVSGEVADGTIATEMASVPYLRWARARIAEGMAARPGGGAGGRAPHRLVTYAWFSIDADDVAALERVRPGIAAYLRREPAGPFVEASGLRAEVAALIERHGQDFAAAIPVEWLRLFSVAGDASQCAAAIRARFDAGADEVALHPGAFDDLDVFEAELARAAREVLPRL
jgi:alkanesulfonate monooxygenase SsuD/methylene tetrahydromethanopterin reductase-like flavin-dependent oxidoreductase (luciferase family)